jgi:hypothetical protein
MEQPERDAGPQDSIQAQAGRVHEGNPLQRHQNAPQEQFRWRKKWARGDVIIVRYADDAVLRFEHREEAEQSLEQLREGWRNSGWSCTRRERA